MDIKDIVEGDHYGYSLRNEIIDVYAYVTSNDTVSFIGSDCGRNFKLDKELVERNIMKRIYSESSKKRYWFPELSDNGLVWKEYLEPWNPQSRVLEYKYVEHFVRESSVILMFKDINDLDVRFNVHKFLIPCIDGMDLVPGNWYKTIDGNGVHHEVRFEKFDGFRFIFISDRGSLEHYYTVNEIRKFISDSNVKDDKPKIYGGLFLNNSEAFEEYLNGGVNVFRERKDILRAFLCSEKELYDEVEKELKEIEKDLKEYGLTASAYFVFYDGERVRGLSLHTETIETLKIHH